MFVAIMSRTCFHCVYFDVLKGDTELNYCVTEATRLPCPVCGAIVENIAIMVDDTELPVIKKGTLGWTRGSISTRSFQRFFSPATSGTGPFSDIATTLRGQMSNATAAKRREHCKSISENYQGTFALSEARHAAKEGDMTGARVAYRVCANSGHSPEAAHAAFELGRLAEEENDFAAAAQWYRMAANYEEPEITPIFLLYLGIALRKINDVDGARIAYQKCVDYGDSIALGMAAFRLGCVLEQQGELDLARQAYEFAVALHDPDGSPHAAVNLAAMEKKRIRWIGAQWLWLREYARCLIRRERRRPSGERRKGL